MRRMESIADIHYHQATGRIAPRPQTRGGIDFRSTLEVRFSWYLDALGERWKYEPRVFGPKGRGYLPDFQILDAALPTYIEVKPLLEDVEPAQRKMSVIWETVPAALLIVACAEARAFYAATKGRSWEAWQERWPA